MWYKKLSLKLFLLFFAAGLCLAQEAAETRRASSGFWSGVGQAAAFGRPFWADMHSTLIRAEIAYATNSPDYDWGEFDTKNRFFIFANLGVDIPIWSANFANGKYGLSITLPFWVEIWYDRFEWVTSPVINTAYRFGVPDINFIYRLDSPRHVLPRFNIYNWALRLSLLRHESTHLGDELTIFRRDRPETFPITRVDVLTNYAELVFTLNDPDGQFRRNHGFRFGVLFNYNFRNGWYTVLESETSGAPGVYPVASTWFPFEFFLQYQYQSALFSHGFQVIASAEYRLRERYKYGFSYSGGRSNSRIRNPPDLANCFNFFLGIRHNNQSRNYFSKIGVGIRYYQGINPHGQFRSMPYYRQLGLVIIFE